MKTSLRKSEWFFIILGSSLTLVSSFLLFTGTSFLKTEAVSEDPFVATYVHAPLPTPTPTPTPSPSPIQTLDANGIPVSMKKIQKAYLIFPAARAVLTKTGNAKKGYPIKFKFEVDPKDTAAVFILNFKNELVISKPLNGSPTGSYEVSILIRKPGLYTWQIKTDTFESEIREVIIKN
jgi:hypothetical protein